MPLGSGHVCVTALSVYCHVSQTHSIAARARLTDMLWGGGAPFEVRNDGDLDDRYGKRVRLLGAVRDVLYELRTDARWEGAVVAVASCTDEPECALPTACTRSAHTLHTPCDRIAHAMHMLRAGGRRSACASLRWGRSAAACASRT